MLFYSTNKKSPLVNFREALLMGLAPDGGLFMSEEFPKLPAEFFKNIISYNFSEIAYEVLSKFIKDIPPKDFEQIISASFSQEAFVRLGTAHHENIRADVFVASRQIQKEVSNPAPLVKLDDKLYVLELFHGPTLSFKDFGARFMARCMNYYLERTGEKLNIIVATSGDTGSAAAAGFYELSNIKVFVLYPRGRISELQEKQIATFGKNIYALEVRGDFDDCQHLAKQALGDQELKSKLNLSSANSINIGRLLPQMLYYFWAVAQLQKLPATSYQLPATFIVPSGNFGNLTAGLFAKRMGLPVEKFVAAVNTNSGVPEYLKTGNLLVQTTRATISNAMDVGNPSNFVRILDLYSHDRGCINKDVEAIKMSEEETKQTIADIRKKYNYIADPHTAVGLGAAMRLSLGGQKIVLSTAHPAKFRDIFEKSILGKIEMPARLESCVKKIKQSIIIPNNYQSLKQFLTQGSIDRT